MFIANLKIFFSSLEKQALFTTINVLGLSVSLACCLLISMYVLDEFSHDAQHPAAERIFRLSSFLTGVEGERTPIPSASPLAGPLLQQNFPEVEAFTRIAEEPVYLSVDTTGNHEDAVRFVDGNFFGFFQFAWLQGDPATALSQPDSIVLTQSLAKKYFGTADPVGRQIHLQNAGPLTVTGLIQDLARTHLRADAFVTMSTLERLAGAEVMESWFGPRFQVYLQLHEAISFTQIQPRLHDFLANRMPMAAKALYDPDSTLLRNIHLSAPQFLGLSGDSRRTEIGALILVCIALVTIACINFVNLATARSGERGKEIAMRKVMGAARAQIFFQHMTESAMLVSVALLLGLGMAELVLPALNAFSGKMMNLAGTFPVLAVLTGLALAVALMAGAYPALYLSALRPVTILGAHLAQINSWHRFRDLLVILQFAIAIVLIVATSVIYLQVQYGKNIALGFDKERVLVVENPLGESWSVVKQRWLALAGVSHVSGAINPPFKPIATSISARVQGNTSEENLAFSMTDADYFELFDVALVAGRAFDSNFGRDLQVQPTAANPHTTAALVINRAMTEKLGWTPQDAVGRKIELNWSEDYSLSVVGEVIGISENMRVDSLRRDVVPLLYLAPSNVSSLGYALVKVSAADLAATVQAIDVIWSEIYPDQPINRYFLDTEFQTIYEKEEAQISLLTAFSALAIIISCLGLFGLATFSTQKRRKEVGIRKTFGGSVWSIVVLLTNDFSRLVLFSNVIAWPVAYFAMSRWLAQFADHIDLTPLIFIGSGLIALCIAWVTVGGTAAKAAAQKPVLALRYE